jgi:hypothetical protein
MENKKEYDFGEIEISTFEEILSDFNTAFETYEVYAFIPAPPRCDGNNRPVDPC